MALNQKFYKEIFEKEEMWLNMIDSNLINIYYLPELKKIYEEYYKRLEYESALTGNNILKSISYAINNIIVKLDYIIEEEKKGNVINLSEIKDFFLLNLFNNNIKPINKITGIQNHKKDLYELRNKMINEELDDDFYYEEKGKAI